MIRGYVQWLSPVELGSQALGIPERQELVIATRKQIAARLAEGEAQDLDSASFSCTQSAFKAPHPCVSASWARSPSLMKGKLKYLKPLKSSEILAPRSLWRWKSCSSVRNRIILACPPFILDFSAHENLLKASHPLQCKAFRCISA